MHGHREKRIIEPNVSRQTNNLFCRLGVCVACKKQKPRRGRSQTEQTWTTLVNLSSSGWFVGENPQEATPPRLTRNTPPGVVDQSPCMMRMSSGSTCSSTKEETTGEEEYSVASSSASSSPGTKPPNTNAKDNHGEQDGVSTATSASAAATTSELPSSSSAPVSTNKGDAAVAAAPPKKEEKAREERPARRKNVDWPMKNIQEPHENDVLFGRGGTFSNAMFVSFFVPVRLLVCHSVFSYQP